VGKHLANESLFIYVATVLWAATLERVTDRDGNASPLDTDTFVDTGMVMYIKPYVLSCAIADLYLAENRCHTSARLRLDSLR